MIIIYLAVAGACAEQEANAGGGGVSPPAGVTLNQLYFSDSATSGANAGCIISLFRNSGSFFPTPSSGVGTNITGLSSPTVTATSTSGTKSAYTLSATTFGNFLTAANTSAQTVYLSIGAFLQFPNNSNTISSISFINVHSINTTSSGIFIFNPSVSFGGGVSQIGATFPQQNSLAIGNTSPIAGLTDNWGLMGTGLLSQTFTSSSNIDYTSLFDGRGRGGTISAGDVITVAYKAKASGGGITEIADHVIEITLT